MMRVCVDGTPSVKAYIVPGVPQVPRTIGAVSSGATVPRHTVVFEARANCIDAPTLRRTTRLSLRVQTRGVCDARDALSDARGSVDRGKDEGGSKVVHGS